MAERFDEQDRDWPQRPWIMAAIGAAGGLIIHLLTDGITYGSAFPVWKQAATTFTVDRRPLIPADGRAAPLDLGDRLRARLGRW